jgi:hypothetical protein
MASSNKITSQNWFLLSVSCLMLCFGIFAAPNSAQAQNSASSASSPEQTLRVTSPDENTAPQSRDQDSRPKPNIISVPVSQESQADDMKQDVSRGERGILGNIFGKSSARTEEKQDSSIRVGGGGEKQGKTFVFIVGAFVLITVAGFAIFFITQFVRDRSEGAVDVTATKSESRRAAASQGSSASLSPSQNYNELVRENVSLRAELDQAKADNYRLRRQLNSLQGVGQVERGDTPTRAYTSVRRPQDQEFASSEPMESTASWGPAEGSESQNAPQTPAFSKQPPSYVDVANIIAEASALNERDFRNRLAALGTLHAVGFNAGEIVIYEDETSLDRTANIIALRSASGGIAILPSREFIRSFTGVRQKIALQPEDLSTIFDFVPDNGGTITYKSMPKVRPRNGDFGPIEIEMRGSLGGFSA